MDWRTFFAGMASAYGGDAFWDRQWMACALLFLLAGLLVRDRTTTKERVNAVETD